MRRHVHCTVALLIASGCVRGGTLPLCRNEMDLKRLDGKWVRLVGVYRRMMTQKKKRGPPVDLGHAGLEIGDREVRLGQAPRPEGERTLWEGKWVVVSGRLVMRPPLVHPPHVAQPLPPPTVFEAGLIEAAPPQWIPRAVAPPTLSRRPALSEMPICRSFDDLRRHDKTWIRLLGTYTEIRTYPAPHLVRSGRVPLHFSHAEIRIEGGRVFLGERPREEMSRFKGKRVTIAGRLDLRPTDHYPPPTLREPGDIKQVDE